MSVAAPLMPDAAFGVERGRWLAHGVAVAGLHALVLVVGLVALPARQTSAEDFGAAMAVEYAELPSEAESEAADAAVETPPGDAQLEMNRIEERLSSAAPDQMPTANASPLEAPPELQLAMQQTQKRQENEQTEETTEAVAESKAAPPPSAATDAAQDSTAADAAERSAASAEGSSSVASNLPLNWQRALVAHLGRNKRYPAKARSARQQGEALVRFVMDRHGAVLSVTMLRGSGHTLLDEEAKAMFARAAPLPSFPETVRAARAELVIPVSFRLK